jgi:hypothetical protein
MADFAGYPNCQNGDVELVFSAGKRMQLHSEILSRHCSFFRDALMKYQPVELTFGAKRAGVSKRWRFDLSTDANNPARRARGISDDNGIGELLFTVSFRCGVDAFPTGLMSSNALTAAYVSLSTPVDVLSTAISLHQVISPLGESLILSLITTRKFLELYTPGHYN